MSTSTKKPHSKFTELLHTQVRNEFNASQQYIALAVWFDKEDLPQLAKFFYAQALEERNHAMIIVQYLMDNDQPVNIPSIDEVRNDFSKAAELVELALKQEKEVTSDITTLAKAARDEDDYQGEQFMQWFLKEQVEEVSSMSTLLNVIKRSNGNLFDVEAHLVREGGGEGADPTMPRVAGGAV
ncbi:ferritin [Tamaricihabitans halophyticus]|uniref:Ferritin n=1 Tax=Tamaricihabitans halophyticus TaxID=1262583 RepID=A0A4R2R5T5_9PSEU|nr:ferritin [Tamaricihabitans halophyticus]TCP57148.1 ferritin [Tamaricihabitans halophyticus]